MKSDCIKHMPKEAQINLIEVQTLIIQKCIKKSLIIGFSIGVTLSALWNIFL